MTRGEDSNPPDGPPDEPPDDGNPGNGDGGGGGSLPEGSPDFSSSPGLHVFHFKDDTEGWLATTGELVDASWRKRHRFPAADEHSPPEQAEAYGGCLRMTVLTGSEATSNYWEWSGTWQGLGVPKGTTVESVQADYLYRWDLPPKSGLSGPADGAHCGPFDLLTGDEELIGRLAAASALATYERFPAGTVINDPVMPGWGQLIGDPISVGQAYNTAIRLRLFNSMPDTTGGGTLILRLKQDRVRLLISFS